MNIDFEDRINELFNMKPGREQVLLAENLFKLAEKDGNNTCAFWALEVICTTSAVYDDGYKAIIYFPKLIHLYDCYFNEILEETSFIGDGEESLKKTILYVEDVVLRICEDYYEISDKKYYEILEDLKEKTIRYGFSLKRYYEIGVERCAIEKDKVGAMEFYKKYKDEKKESYQSCESTEVAVEVYYRLCLNDLNEVKNLLRKLFKGNNEIEEIHKVESLQEILKYSLLNNIDLEKELDTNIESYINKSIRHMNKNRNIFGAILIMYYSTRDIDKALSLFTQDIKRVNKSRNNYYRVNFYGSATILFEVIKYKLKKDSIKLLLPNSLDFYKDSGVYNVDNLIEKFRGYYEELLIKFDGKKSKCDIDYIEKVRVNIIKTFK